jgi:hypothetical protein
MFAYDGGLFSVWRLHGFTLDGIKRIAKVAGHQSLESADPGPWMYCPEPAEGRSVLHPDSEPCYAPKTNLRDQRLVFFMVQMRMASA